MNSSQIFDRYERKFILTDHQKEEFEKVYQNRLRKDENGNGAYKVYSIYFDDNHQNSIRESLSKPIYKEKLRIRSYHCFPNLNDMVYLEMKKKFQNHGCKRRIKASYSDCLDYIKHKRNLHFDDFLSTQVVNEMSEYLCNHPVTPTCLVSSERFAYYDLHDDNLRITFDHQVNAQFYPLTGDNKKSLLKDNDWIMEIKFVSALPLWLVEALSKMNIYSQPFSKYGKAFNQYLETKLKKKEKN